MVTIVEEILEKAAAYPDRLAIVRADGTLVRYGELDEHVLPRVKQWIHFTTGSTGIPKQFVITDANLRRRHARLEVIRGEKFAAMTTLFVPVAPQSPLGTQLQTYLLLKGGTVFMLGSNMDVGACLDMCTQHQVEGCAYVPKLRHCADLARARHRYRFKSVFLSGAAETPDRMNEIRHALADDLWVNYAASEVGQIAGGPLERVGHTFGCVGKVADDLQVEVVNGEIRIRAPETTVDGYVDAPELTTRHFRDGWFYPGDRGRFDGDLLVIEGRA